jgi:hypothetical protein
LTKAYDKDYDHFNLGEKVIVMVSVLSLEKLFITIKTNNISDNKRQQTTTVDNKRLINGFLLTSFVSLQREKQILKTRYKNEK